MSIPPIIGVSEIVLSVKDISLMEKFYEQHLGFKTQSASSLESETNDPDGNPTIVFMSMFETDSPLGKNGHPQFLVLIDHARHVWAKPRFDGHDVKRSTLNHLAFEIPLDSYDAHLNRLKQAELNPLESEFDSFHAKAIFFNDPEGNALELICSLADQ